MILLPEKRLAFHHIPKTGGTSITHALYRALHPEGGNPPRNLRELHEGRHMHEVAATPAGWTGFAVRRDPVERAVSMFQQDGKKGEALIDFLSRPLDNPDLRRPQADWLRNCQVVLEYDHLGRDWEALARISKLPFPLPKRNAAKVRSKDWSVSPAERALIKQIWPEDF